MTPAADRPGTTGSPAPRAALVALAAGLDPRTAGRHRAALWLGTWGKSCPMCRQCWDATRQVAQARRPSVVITGTNWISPRTSSGAPAVPARHR